MPSASSRRSRATLASLFTLGSPKSSKLSSRRTPLVAFAALALLAAPGCAASGEDKLPSGVDGAIGDGASDTSIGDDAVATDAPVGDAPPGDGTPGDSAHADVADAADVGGDACATSCTVGDKSCDGNAVRTCEVQGSCTGFGAKVDCPTGQVCSAGKCAATCTDQCTLNDKRCSGTQIQTCDKQASGCTDWSMATSCPAPQACSANTCKLTCTDNCVSGAKQCGGPDSTQLCALQTTGCYDWNPATTCAGGLSCTAGTCAPCTTGATRCGTTGNVEQCTAGAWAQTQSCAFGCSAGACSTTVTCTAGAYRCSGNNVEICNSSGTAWLYSQSCAVACSAGLCTGNCTAAAKRCNAGKVETCNAAGTAWDLTTTCTTVCDPTTSSCALASLTIDPTTTTSFDGEIVVNGPVVVKTGSTLNSTTGNLKIRATSITVETGGSITAAPTGVGSAGSTGYTACTSAPGGGGGGSYQGVATDASVIAGSKGGTGGYCNCGTGGGGGNGGNGGGVIQLIADTIVINGQVTANGANGGAGTPPASCGYTGGGGGGSGGGILLAGNSVTIAGAVSAGGGSGGPGGGGGSNGIAGGAGRVKVLYGATKSVSGTITGSQTLALLPPLTITSSTHPDPGVIYNDDFQTFALAWNKAFPSVLGYYERLDTTASNVPTPANGTFNATEVIAFPRSALSAGWNYFHIDPIDATSSVGTVENLFKVQINVNPPTLSSTSHPTQTTWTSNPNVFYAWALPGTSSSDTNYKGFWYVLDHYGTTVPTATDTFIPISQKTLLRTGLADGVWAFHIVSVDVRGYPTRSAGLYRVRLGADPGSGSVLGTVVDNASKPVVGATVTVNKGLFNFAGEAPNQATNSSGAYSFPAAVPAGSWEVTVTPPAASGLKAQTQTIAVTKAAAATLNFTLLP